MGSKKVVTSEMNSVTPVLVINSQTMFTVVPLNNHIYIYICTHTHTHKHTNIHTHIYIYVTDIYRGEEEGVCTHIYPYIPVYIICIYIYTHTCKSKGLQS